MISDKAVEKKLQETFGFLQACDARHYVYSHPILPPILRQSCHPFSLKAATDSQQSCHPLSG